MRPQSQHRKHLNDPWRGSNVSLLDEGIAKWLIGDKKIIRPGHMARICGRLDHPCHLSRNDSVTTSHYQKLHFRCYLRFNSQIQRLSKRLQRWDQTRSIAIILNVPYCLDTLSWYRLAPALWLLFHTSLQLLPCFPFRTFPKISLSLCLLRWHR